LVETGKTIAKSGKASVRNGTCRWTETFSESTFISEENGDSNEVEGGHFKFVVAMVYYLLFFFAWAAPLLLTHTKNPVLTLHVYHILRPLFSH